MSNKTNKEVYDESSLVSGLKKGSEQAYKRLISEHQSALYGVAFGITRDREESLDILQEVFLKVHRKIGKFRGDSSLSTWLRRITVNEALNFRRKWKRRLKWMHKPLVDDDDKESPELGTYESVPEDLLRGKQFESVFFDKLGKLPDEARAVFVLKEFDGLSYEEISKVMGIKKGTVSSKLFYARKKLKESLKPYMEGE